MKNNVVIENEIKSLKNQIQFKKRERARLTALPEGPKVSGLILRKWLTERKSDSSSH